jgi:hypothetical protein
MAQAITSPLPNKVPAPLGSKVVPILQGLYQMELRGTNVSCLLETDVCSVNEGLDHHLQFPTLQTYKRLWEIAFEHHGVKRGLGQAERESGPEHRVCGVGSSRGEAKGRRIKSSGPWDGAPGPVLGRFLCPLNPISPQQRQPRPHRPQNSRFPPGRAGRAPRAGAGPESTRSRYLHLQRRGGCARVRKWPR